MIKVQEEVIFYNPEKNMVTKYCLLVEKAENTMFNRVTDYSEPKLKHLR